MAAPHPMSLIGTLREDFRRNRGNIKLVVIVLYRFAHLASVQRKRSKIHWIWAVPYLVFYRLLTEFLLGLELPAATVVGKGLILDHGYALVVNKSTIIGEYCRLRHSTTIGCKLSANGKQGASPRLGNHVDVGANCVIVGDIDIGDNVSIGAGSVVVHSIPANSVVVGNPARVIGRKDYKR